MKKSTIAICLSATLVGSMAGSGLQAADNDNSEAFDSLQTHLSGIETLVSDVTQLIVESDGAVIDESEILFKLKRPDGFYWETLAPFPELIVTDGERLWSYQPDLEQVVIEDWNAERSELAAQLLSGNTEKLVEEYEITFRTTESGGGITEFDLDPVAPESLYERVTLTFVDEALDMIYVEQTSGQRTVWQFENLVLNEPLPDSTFTFSVPDGVEVIENSYATR
ncbi:MAG: outer membrane lipoprotein chaperone LolA [Pseudohongiellaceae bacterium]